LPKIQLDLDADGEGTIIIDDHDFSSLVAGIQILVVPGQETSVNLQLVPIALQAEGEFEQIEMGGDRPA